MPPWGWLQKAGAAAQGPGGSRGRAPEQRTAGPGRPGPAERPAPALVHSARTRGWSTPRPAVRLPGLPAGALEGHLGVPAEETGGAWVAVGRRGWPGRSGPGSSAHGVRSCLGARRPEWTCPRLETHVPRSSSSQASSRSQWVVPPATSLETHPMACGRPSRASWEQRGQGAICAEPCSWSPEAPSARPAASGEALTLPLGAWLGVMPRVGHGGQREEDSRRGDK